MHKVVSQCVVIVCVRVSRVREYSIRHTERYHCFI